MDNQQKCVEAYARLKSLHAVGAETGISWQMVYVHLKKAGVTVTGDKEKYGSDKDKLAAKAEADFQLLVPYAENQNKKMFQPKIDFLVNGFGVDVKASRLNKGFHKSKVLRWAFSCKKQEACADFIVCFGYKDDDYAIFLIPGELIRKYQSVSISPSSKGKWAKFAVSPQDLKSFFDALKESKAA
jgi:hypothetical protein